VRISHRNVEDRKPHKLVVLKGKVQDEMRGECSHGRYKKYIHDFGRKPLKGRERFIDLELDEIVLKCTIKRWRGRVWSGPIWRTIRASGGPLSTL
jgi:hypothetical protein